MSGSLKISTALLICSVFVFRLYFINIGLLASVDSSTQKDCSGISQLYSTHTKVESSDASGNFRDLAAEICEEEDAGENGQFKADPFLFFQLLYTFFSDGSSHDLQKGQPCASHLAYVPSHRYIALQVFRI